MTRAPFQVLVFPYRFPPGGGVEYAVFKRADLGFWQGISGGGEDAETPFEAAKREALEEGGIPPESRYMALDATATIPVVDITGDLRGETACWSCPSTASAWMSLRCASGCPRSTPSSGGWAATRPAHS